MEEYIKRVRLSIEGRVQGVGFRYFTVRKAKGLKEVTGWVKNEADGSVTVVAEGPKTELNKLIRNVAEGPRSARVDGMKQNWSEASGEFDSFKVKY